MKKYAVNGTSLWGPRFDRVVKADSAEDAAIKWAELMLMPQDPPELVRVQCADEDDQFFSVEYVAKKEEEW